MPKGGLEVLVKYWRLPTIALVTAAAVTSGSGEAAGRFGAYDAQAKALLARMTLDEKLGQITQPDQEFLKDQADLEKYAFGSIQSGGDSDPRTNSVEDWRDMYERYQAHMAKTRLRIPMLYGADTIHGHSNVVGAVIFPHNIGLGATRDAALVEEIGRVTAEETRATGINWGFAPCVTVPQDERWGRSYEGFSEDPRLVAELGAAAVRGLQGRDLKDPRRILACAKHFAGDGGTAWGTGMSDTDHPGVRYPLDRGDTRGDEATLRRIHMAGYVAAIEAGVGSIMPSFSSWNGERLSGSRRLLTEILKGELGFDGFLISDYNAIEDLPGDYAAQIKQAMNAGMDMVMAPSRYREFFATLKRLVEQGDIPQARIDDAVKRILRVKLAMGLMDEGRDLRADRSLLDTFGSASHRAVARRAVRESLVVLKNEGHTLPLKRGAKRIHVAGASADDLGNQCGGWTITWQGRSGTPTQGTTILAAVSQLAGKDSKITYSRDGSGAAGADFAIVVVGEKPYAEFQGDRSDLGLSAEDVAMVAAVKKSGVPTVVVLLSGRPMILGDVLSQADAVVAAWLPGSEGGGVADVLFGDFKPTGRLPVSWPRSTSQIPINLGDAHYDPLFAYGYGLAYDDGGPPAEMLVNGGFAKGDANWVVEENGGAKGQAEGVAEGPDGQAALRFTVLKATDQPWHLQIYQKGLRVQKGKTYVMRFWARSDRAGEIMVNCMQNHAPWEHHGAAQKTSLSTDWKPMEFTFVGPYDDDDMRITFTNLGVAANQVYWFARCSLVSDAATGPRLGG